MRALSILSLGLAFVLSAQADLIKFQLSPPGTDVAVGLSPSNTVPPAVGSTGSGGTIAGGITFDPDTRRLFIAVGYGSAAGFTDLSAPETTSHIHFGAPGTSGNVQLDLHPIHYPATNPTSGVYVGTLIVNSEDVSNLLAGLLYFDIHTSSNFSGELRGQLIPMSGPPLVVCPPPAVLECGSSATTLVTLTSDPEGEELSVVWSVNGTTVATNTVPASVPCLPAMTTITQDFPLGTNVVQVTVTDASSNTVSCSTTVTVLDTNPPVIVSASADPSNLWPPNHRMVDIRVNARVSDACGATTWKILRVTSSEPVNGTGDGDTAPDWIITGDHTLKLRAERSGHTRNRVYTITLQAQDASRNPSATKTICVTVGKGGEGDDDGDEDDDHEHGNKGNGHKENGNKGNGNKGNGKGR